MAGDIRNVVTVKVCLQEICAFLEWSLGGAAESSVLFIHELWDKSGHNLVQCLFILPRDRVPTVKS